MSCISLTVNEDIYVARETPTLTFGSATINVPEHAFLQAVPDAESQMQSLVENGLKKCKTVADLFCGVGTFTLSLARTSRIQAYDNDVPAIEALTSAVRHTQGLKPVTAVRRDLFRQPLSARELKGIKGAVINPPRAGGQKQCEQLTKSEVSNIVMVSCNPQTFARDARILMDGGYTMGAISPIDQFLWSPHLEIVARFTRR